MKYLKSSIAALAISGLLFATGLASATGPTASGTYGGVDYQEATSVPFTWYSGSLTQHQGQGTVSTFRVTHCPWKPVAQAYDCTAGPLVGGNTPVAYQHNSAYWTPYAYGYHVINCCGGTSPTLETFDSL